MLDFSIIFRYNEFNKKQERKKEREVQTTRNEMIYLKRY